jgi:hypothetical protein
MNSTCTCSYLKIGTTVSDNKNLNPECPEHGHNSVWYNSPEQVKKRGERSQRLRELYAARRKAQEKLNETHRNN